MIACLCDDFRLYYDKYSFNIQCSEEKNHNNMIIDIIS